KRNDAKNHFFGFDAGHSWFCGAGRALPHIPPEHAARLLKLAGAAHVRDRMLWREVEPSDGTLLPGRYLANAKLMRQNNVSTTQVYVGTPQFIRKGAVLPADLLRLMQSSAKLSQSFRGECDQWEYLNEPDLPHNATEPAWEVAAIQKAALYGLRKGNKNATLMTSSLCMEPDSAFASVIVQNMVPFYADAWNYHCYSSIREYPACFRRMRSMLAKTGKKSMPIAITELGTHAEGLCKADSADGKNKAHSPEQEFALTQFHTKAQIVLRQEGIWSAYAFLLLPYHESDGLKDWGFLRKDGTVKPGYAALAAQSALLANHTLEGELKLPAKEVRAFLFKNPSGRQLIAYWRVSDLENGKPGASSLPLDIPRAFQLPLPNGTYTHADLFGKKQPISIANGSLQATAQIQYLLDLAPLQSPALIPAIKPDEPGANAPDGSEEEYDRSIVIRPILSAGDFEITNGRTVALLRGKTGKITLEFWNLSDVAKKICVQVSGGKLDNLPEFLTLPPQAKTAVETVFTPTEGALTIGGTSGKQKITCALIPCERIGNLLQKGTIRSIGILDATRWQRNTSGKNFRTSLDKEQNAIRFDVEFPAGNRWIYPSFPLAPGKRLSKKANMLVFEIKSKQDKVENDFTVANEMLVNQSDGKAKYLPFSAPRSEWENRYVSLENLGFPPEQAHILRIGANPKGHKLTYWIRNLRVVEGTK
ncbi:MAG: hypothetical protein PHS41_07990, partial [Victivallaceae bacterium]|nr:hypothetical protein [Victivallaceae bacterium]